MHTVLLSLAVGLVAVGRTGDVGLGFGAAFLAAAGCAQESVRRALMLQSRWSNAVLLSVGGVILLTGGALVRKPDTAREALVILALAQFAVSVVGIFFVTRARPVNLLGSESGSASASTILSSNRLVLAAVAYWVIAGGFLAVLGNALESDLIADLRKWQNLFSGLLLVSVAVDNAFVAAKPGADRLSKTLLSGIGLVYSVGALTAFGFVYGEWPEVLSVGGTLSVGYIALTITRFELTRWKRDGLFAEVAAVQSIGAVILLLGLWTQLAYGSVSTTVAALTWLCGILVLLSFVLLAPPRFLRRSSP